MRIVRISVTHTCAHAHVGVQIEGQKADKNTGYLIDCHLLCYGYFSQIATFDIENAQRYFGDKLKDVP